jgi:hypothetical protein
MSGENLSVKMEDTCSMSSDEEEIQIQPEIPINDDIFDTSSLDTSKVLQCELCQQMFTHKVRD